VASEHKGYTSFRASGLPAGPFGETYVIVSIAEGPNGSHWIEYFVVSKRHEPRLHHEAFQVFLNDVPEELLSIDPTFFLSEGRQQAENYLWDVLYQLAEKHGDHLLDHYRVELIEQKATPLHNLWFRGELHDEIRAVAKETRNPQLKRVLELVTRSSFMRRG
jgi:hypothetical protein